MALRTDHTAQREMPTHRDPNGKFRNPWPQGKPRGLREVLDWAWNRRAKQRAEPTPATVAHTAPSFPSPRAATDDIVITWIGHSSFLLQIGSSNILLDPIWSSRASPVPFAGPKRITDAAVNFNSLPPIDFVLISHDHYDHLDAPTVRMIVAAHPHAEWVVPLGVATWLRSRGAIVTAELDWWQSVHTRQLDITCTPAQHFSGRRPDNRDSTLWCGWVVRASVGERAVFFAGDTGRHPEFASIARQLGPFDAALLPIGAYDPRWFMKPVHMSPDEAVSAYCDIATANAGHACRFIATHWGTFRLTDEPMDEPPMLTRAAWSRIGLDPALLWIPMHGETLKF